MVERAASDLALVEAILRGERSAFAEIVGRYQRLVASVAWRYGVRREEIEDVVSDVFVKTFEQLPRYRAEHPFSTWLYRLAVNHVIDRGRRRAAERRRAELPAEIVDPRPAPDADLAANERGALVRRALGSVAPRYREVLFLVYGEGLKLDQAARLLGLPLGTIKTRLMRGREALRKILVARHPDEFEG